jgi:hypothetical protein
VVELFDGKGIRVHVRTDGPFHCGPNTSVVSCQRRGTSTDGGLTFGNWSDQSDIPTPAVRGGLARWTAGKGLVAANCADQALGDGKRVDVTVRISLDNGDTFPHSLLVDELGGYVTVEMISEQRIGVIYDQGADCGPVAFASMDAAAVLNANHITSDRGVKTDDDSSSSGPPFDFRLFERELWPKWMKQFRSGPGIGDCKALQCLQ